MGMRAEESPARARKTPWRRNDRMSVAGREVFDWLPVFDLSTKDVFRVIHDAGQSPHWAYAAGMSRLSCSFCILASRADLRRAAELRPDLYRTYAELERRIGPHAVANAPAASGSDGRFLGRRRRLRRPGRPEWALIARARRAPAPRLARRPHTPQENE